MKKRILSLLLVLVLAMSLLPVSALAVSGKYLDLISAVEAAYKDSNFEQTSDYNKNEAVALLKDLNGDGQQELVINYVDPTQTAHTVCQVWMLVKGEPLCVLNKSFASDTRLSYYNGAYDNQFGFVVGTTTRTEGKLSEDWGAYIVEAAAWTELYHLTRETHDNGTMKYFINGKDLPSDLYETVSNGLLSTGQLPVLANGDRLDAILEFAATHVHSYEMSITGTSCTDPGSLVFTCPCGHSYTQPSQPFAHTPGEYKEENFTDKGYDVVLYCSVCKQEISRETLKNPPSITEVERLSGKGRCDTAIAAAEALKSQLKVEKFEYMILASGTNFADALAGSYLAAVKSAPILLFQKGNEAKTVEYILNNLSETGKLYLLGGNGAVPAYVEEVLTDCEVTVHRLAGKTRYDTNVAILEEAGVADGQEVLVCTAFNYADSLSASATGLPILLVNSKAAPGKALTAAQEEFLYKRKDLKLTILGGKGAISTEIYDSLGYFGDLTRVAGKSRFDTSVMIAERYFPEADTVVIAYGRNFPDGLSGGALAYAIDAPLLLTAAGAEAAAAEFTQSREIPGGYVLGGTGALSEQTVSLIFGK